MTTRRLLLGAALAAPALPSLGRGALAQAPAWPQRSVRFIVSLAPGGLVDTIARLVAENIRDIWGQTVIVENRPGASGNVAAQVLTRTAPDGYTALFTTAAFAINLTLFRNPGYSAEQFLPAAVVAGQAQLFLVRADSPIRTLRDLVETARRRPVNYGTPGTGSPGHLLAETLFRRAGGTDTTHVAYAGAGPAMAALLAGDVEMVTAGLTAAVPQIRAGRARGVAITSATRNGAVPEVPTVAETGLDPLVDLNWAAMLFPAGTPQAVLERTNADVRQVMARPAFQERIAALGLEPIGGDLPTAQAFVASEIARWRDIVRTANVLIE